MNRARAMLIVVGVVAACEVSGAAVSGQEPGRKEDRTEKLKRELRRIDVAIKPGDELVALSDTQLMVEAKAVAAVRKGQKLSVEHIQDRWLWVHGGDVRGWVDRRAVISIPLWGWYQRLPDGEYLEAAGRARGKCEGVVFEIAGAGERNTVGNSFRDVTYNGIPIRGEFSGVTFDNLGIIVRKQGERRALAIHFARLSGPFGGIFEAALQGRSYGNVNKGDYLFIDAGTRSVYVNGELRSSP